MDPILSQATPHVEPLAALTQPQGTTFVQDHVYFRCVQEHCSAIREDGKKLTFMNFHFKTNIKEDIDYLRKQIAAGIVHFAECVDKDAIAIADQAVDPQGAVERRIRAQVIAELAAAGVDVNAAGNLPTEQAAADAATATANLAAVTVANAGAQQLAGVDASTLAAQRLAAMKQNNAQQAVINQLTSTAAPLLTPMSTSDIAGAASGSNSGDGGGSVGPAV